jgi:hypothetical protein
MEQLLIFCVYIKIYRGDMGGRFKQIKEWLEKSNRAFGGAFLLLACRSN